MDSPYWIKSSLINYLTNNDFAITPSDANLRLIKEWSQSSDFSSECLISSHISFPDLLSKATLWSKNKRSPETKEGPQDIINIIDSTDNYKWVLLKSENSYIRESQLMRHCVKEYYKYQNETSIYSLRDTHNMPHATLEIKDIVINEKRMKCLIQISGKANQQLKLKYTNHLKIFLDHFHNSNWAFANNPTYAINNLFFDSSLQKIINFSELTYYKGNLNLVQFKGNMPKNLILDGNLNLTLANPQSLSNTLLIIGTLSIKGTSFDIPASWSFNKLIK